jgi:hypothetical protein
MYLYFYMARDVMILMQANPLLGPLVSKSLRPSYVKPGTLIVTGISGPKIALHLFSDLSVRIGIRFHQPK